MTQLSFLPPAHAGYMGRDGWIGASQCGMRYDTWQHPSYPAVAIRHCGHPTAIRPYYIEGLTPRGFISRKFHNLEHAKLAVIEAHEGGGT
jgi:hypothetical protein